MRATRAYIRLDNLRHNIRALRARLAKAPRPGRDGIGVCMAVKADAYGHGAVRVSQVALAEGVDWLGVATVEEGAELREAGVRAPLILLGLAFPEEAQALVENDITPFVAEADAIRHLGNESARQGKRLPVHIKIDTGMGRIGCRPEEAPALAALIRQTPSLRLEGLATHFPLSDTADDGFTAEQIALLKRTLAAVGSRSGETLVAHAANSGALIDKPSGFFNVVRPGILLYGYYPSGGQERSLPVRPVMEFKTRVIFIKKVPAGTGISYGLAYRTERETCIATLPVGYGDGYSRLLSNRASVWIGGQRYPVAGRVCMDQTMVDLGPSPAVRVGDEVVLFGAAPGAPDAEEIARLMGTIPYEVTCLIAKRVPRLYVDEAASDAR